MKNKLTDLNNHLFEQLERLNDDDLTGDDLDKEIKRADAMVKIAGRLVESTGNQIRAAALIAEQFGDKEATFRALFGNTGQKQIES